MLATLRLPRASARGGRFIFVCQLLENVISLVDFIDSTRESTRRRLSAFSWLSRAFRLPVCRVGVRLAWCVAGA
jgi:hypothetical protein